MKILSIILNFINTFFNGHYGEFSKKDFSNLSNYRSMKMKKLWLVKEVSVLKNLSLGKKVFNFFHNGSKPT